MLFKKPFLSILLFVNCILSIANGQQTKHYNLVKLLHKNKLDTTANGQEIQEFANPKNQAISVQGVLWLKDLSFKEGVIDVDLRGKNIFLKSFMGIAFHAKDLKNYDVVYFCPFRFHDTNLVTRKYSVKYMSKPDHDYLRLRKEYPGVYENDVKPAPQSDDWFHTTIVVKDGWVTVYVNHSAVPSLKVRQLNDIHDGKIGLWSYAATLNSDFANLSITE